jgi:hypothetical protein
MYIYIYMYMYTHICIYIYKHMYIYIYLAYYSLAVDPSAKIPYFRKWFTFFFLGGRKHWNIYICMYRILLARILYIYVHFISVNVCIYNHDNVEARNIEVIYDIYMYIYIYIYLYIYIYICLYVCIYLYIYIYIIMRL